MLAAGCASTDRSEQHLLGFFTGLTTSSFGGPRLGLHKTAIATACAVSRTP